MIAINAILAAVLFPVFAQAKMATNPNPNTRPQDNLWDANR